MILLTHFCLPTADTVKLPTIVMTVHILTYLTPKRYNFRLTLVCHKAAEQLKIDQVTNLIEVV